MAVETTRILPDVVYTDEMLRDATSVSNMALAKARRDGRLRHTRQGQRYLYLGQWVLDWLHADAIPPFVQRNAIAVALKGGAA